MQRLQAVKANDAVEFRQHAVQIVCNVIARVRHVARVEAHAKLVFAPAGVKNGAQLFKPAADLAALAGHRFEQNGRMLPGLHDRVETRGNQVNACLNALPDVAAGVEIIEIPGRQLHALQIVRKDLTGKFARPFILRAGVQRIRRMRHKRTEQPALLHLHKHGGVRRVGAFRRAAARIARKELKCVRADRKRGPSHRGISL